MRTKLFFSLWIIVCSILLATGLAAQTAAGAIINIQSPANNATIDSPVMQVTATATGTYSIFAIQVFVDNVLKANAGSNSIDIGIPLTTGKHVVALSAWDVTGHSQTKTVNVTCVATSSTVQHHASLGWAASPSSVMGYNIYRSSGPSGPFTRLNSDVEPATVFTDYSVVAGQTYYYAVTSVSAQGESGYSNLVMSTIPSD